MKKIKIILDIVMIIIMLLLMNMQITGLDIHETLGIIIFVLFVIHKVLNIKWIKAISKNIFKKNIKIKTKIMYWLDVILLVTLTINVLTGILISKCILTDIAVTNISLTTNIHNIISWFSLIIIAIHIAFHLDSIIAKIKKIIKKSNIFSIVDIIVKIIYTIIATITIYLLIKATLLKNYNGKIQESNSNQSVITQKDDDKSQKSNTITNSIVTDVPESIEEYLSKLYCTGCGRHCPLTNPQCGKGVSSQTQKVQEYNETYNTTETYSSSSNTVNKKK